MRRPGRWPWLTYISETVKQCRLQYFLEIYLHKLLPLLALPTGLLLSLLAIALLLQRRLPIWLALSLFWLGSTPWASDHLVRWSEANSVRQTVSTMRKAHAIVVLSEGRILAPGPTGMSEWDDGDRFWGGIELYRSGKAPWLVFTGGWVPWQPEPGTRG